MENSNPSEAEKALGARLLDLEVHVYATRTALQALIASTPCSPRMLAAFDEASSRLLARIALDGAQRPLLAEKESLGALRKCLADWRHFLTPPETPSSD